MEWKKMWFVPTLGLAVFFYLAIPSWAQVEIGDVVVSGSGEIGGLPRALSGKKAKFEEYRDVPETVVVPELQFKLERKKEDYYLHFDATDVGQDDQNYRLRYGKYGLLDMEFEWDQAPHFFSSNTARTPYARNSGTQTLLSKPASTAGTDVRDWINASANTRNLNLYKGLAKFKVRYTPTPGWAFTGRYISQNDSGKRAFGSIFGTSPGQFNITELIEPIDYQTHNIELGGEYAGKGWSVDLRYNGSLFHNNTSTLTWDNPINPGIGSACTEEAAYSNTAGTGPCQGRTDLYPSNQAHTFTLSGTTTLPLKSHFMGTVSYGWRTQDDSFLPFTTNDALLASLANPPTISDGDLDGDVRPLMINATLVNRYFEDLGFKAYYRLYDLDNKSKRVFLEQGYIDGDSGTNTLELLSFPYEYSKQNIGLNAKYKITRSLNTKFEYVWEKLHRARREVLDSIEHTFGPTFDFTPTPWLLFRSSYRRSLRDAHDYDIGRKTAIILNRTADEIREEDLAALRKYEEAARNRDTVGLFTQITPLDNLVLHSAFDFNKDSYTRSQVGLKDNVSYVPSVGFNYAPSDWISFFGDYNYDRSDWKMKSMNRSAELGATGCPNRDQQTPQNCPSSLWNSRGNDRVHTAGVGSDIVIIKDLLNFHVGYNFSYGSSKVRASGNSTPGNNPAVNFPEVTTRWQELFTRFEFLFHKNVSLRFGYYFNRFDSDDFGLDIMNVFMGDVDTSGGVQRSIFLGDNIKKDYTAHVGFLGLRFTF